MNGPDGPVDAANPFDVPLAWPMDDTDVVGAATIHLHCPTAAPLTRLAEWGLHGTPVINHAGQTVAVLLEEHDTSPDLETVWQVLASSFGEHGLWPVVAQGLDGDLRRPWLDDLREWEQDPPLPVDVLDLLASKTSPEEPPPWDRRPTALAEGTPGDTAQLYPPAVLDGEGLLVVPVARPSEVPRAIGWLGAVNHGLDGNAVSAVLGRWEDQFGAVLMRLGFDTIDVQVARPPSDEATRDAVAWEHVLFCPDQIQWGENTSLQSYAAHEIDSLRWSFWWD